ncbi:MAG: YfhO family protein [Flavobacteriaceae bacterium]|nr:YfhO family protein [Flavobacteriaceae bacterium]
MKFSLKKCLPHLLMVIGFVVASLLYFNPVLEGKQIFQSDIVQYTGMAKQQNDFRADTGEETYWTNSAFGGMPTYQLGAKYPHNYIKKLDLALRFLPRPADYMFLYFIGFYILLLVLKVDYKFAGIGALAFGFSTYLIIILGVGHNAKAHAIAYMPLVLSGILLTFQRKYILGFLFTTIAMALEMLANHFQMTYYLLLLVLVLGIVYLIDAFNKQLLPHFVKSVGILIVAVVLAIGLNATNILATQEYAKESTRSKSELTINPDGSPKEVTSGLDTEYITEYSYGIVETFNLFIPRFMGGGSYEDVGRDSETFKFFRSIGATPKQALQESKQTPTYWGNQPIVEAPAYVGAVVLFLFVIALFLVKGRLKWWLVAGTLLSLLLSYGKNFSFLTDLFINYVPLYNKFRAVSSIQVILELCIPILAVFGLYRLLNDFEHKDQKLKALKYSTLITAGLALVFLVFKTTLFDFSGARDGSYIQAYGHNFISALKGDRIRLFNQDTIRTLVLVLLSSGVIYFFLKEKISGKVVFIAFTILILFDLVVVDRRYVNNDNFVSAVRMQKPYQPSEVDQFILEDNGHYRVFDVTTGNTRPNYFHNSINGYHAAKMRRYNELFDFHISKNNMEVLNMLNTKYIIAEQEGQIFPFENEDANGNAWFIESSKSVESPNEAIIQLDSLNTKKVALVENGSISNEKLINDFVVDSLAIINLKEVKPNYLKYVSSNTNEGFAVLSEIYYKKGWQAYIDGKETPHIRVNYVLRGLLIPNGKHTIEFKFEPQVVKTGSQISLASSVLVGLLILGGLYYEFKKKRFLISQE